VRHGRGLVFRYLVGGRGVVERVHFFADEDGDDELVAVEAGEVGGDDVLVELAKEVVSLVGRQGGFQEEVGLDGAVGVVDIGLADALVGLPDEIDLGG